MDFCQEIFLVILGSGLTALIGIIGYFFNQKKGNVKVIVSVYDNWGETIANIGFTNTKPKPVIISDLRLIYDDKGDITDFLYDMSTKEANNIISTIDKTSSYELQPNEAKNIKCLVKINPKIKGRKTYLVFKENGKPRKEYMFTQDI